MDIYTSIIVMLANSGCGLKEDFVGCNLDDIQQIESTIHSTLPLSYKQYLMAMGRKSGKMFMGSDILFPELLVLKAYATELLKEDDSLDILTDNTFVFLCHQGYTFYFFKIEKDINDPIVYEYVDGSKTSNKLNETFSEFMYKAASEYSNHFERKMTLE